jgi:hypothetical protein
MAPRRLQWRSSPAVLSPRSGRRAAALVTAGKLVDQGAALLLNTGQNFFLHLLVAAPREPAHGMHDIFIAKNFDQVRMG